MKKTLLFVMIALIGLGLLYSCNKQKPIKLDYTEQKGMYDPQGLPGEGYVGSPPEDLKHTGYNHGDQAKKDEKNDEKKKEEKKEKK